MTMTKIQSSVLVAVVSAVALGAPVLWVNSIASDQVGTHDKDDVAHSKQHSSLKDSLSIVKSKQVGFQKDISHITQQLQDVKESNKEIDAKLDRILERI